MCTLVLGFGVVAPRSVLIAANRDEDPERPTDPPRPLGERPALVGGRDRRAGGTWLAVRDGRSAVALLNRPPWSAPAPAAPRSRGLLTLDVAAAPAVTARGVAGGALGAAGSDPGARAALAEALASLGRDAYAPFTLVYASPDACWTLSHDGRGPARAAPLAPGWHVVTHADPDDPGEPRTAWLLERLAGQSPPTRAGAEALLTRLLSLHAGEIVDGREAPDVCLHRGRLVTVSRSLLWLAPGEAHYAHAEGRPCERPAEDLTDLLAGRTPAPEPA